MDDLHQVALGCPGAIDFTTIEVWTRGGLVTYYLLFVMEVATRRVHFAGCTANPDEPWMKQIARNLTDCEDGFLNGKRFLIMDRDTKFSDAFRKTLEDEGVESVRLPPRSPNLNPHLERFMRSLKDESLSRLIFFGETSLRTAVGQFLEHYHGERNHQGLGNQLINPGEEVGRRRATSNAANGLAACFDTIIVMLHERTTMFKRLKTWLVDWAERYQQREIEPLHAESCRLKEELMELNGGEPIRLSPEQRRQLAEKAKGIDPEVLSRSLCSRLKASIRSLPTTRRRNLRSSRRHNSSCCLYLMFVAVF